jgi:hypothetical protein
MAGRSEGMGAVARRVVRGGRSIAALGAIAALAAGCPHDAQIIRFDATPRHICPGGSVELAWEFDGAGTLTVTPAVASVPGGAVETPGKAVLHPAAHTVVDLAVTHQGGAPTGARLEIEMSPGEAVAASLADDSAACRGGMVSSTAHVKNFAPDLEVSVIGLRPGDARASYDVTHVEPRTHQPVTAHVTADAPASNFAGLPINGDWIIASPVRSDESCDAPGLPSNLVIVAYTTCGGGGQP